MIKRLLKSDISTYYALRLEMLQAAPTAYGMSFEEEQARGPVFVDSILSDNSDGNVIFGTYSNQMLVGAVGIFAEKGLKRKHVAKIWGMYVQSSQRRHGLGKLLVQTAIEHGRLRMCAQIVHLSVESTNEAAIGLYLAFLDCGRKLECQG